MNQLTVSSPLLNFHVPAQLTQADIAIIWAISDELDKQRIPSLLDNAQWVTIASKKLRSEESRDDNYWVKKCLDKLMGIKLSGEYRNDPWGAVLIAQWEIKERGSIINILIPPKAIEAIRAPQTFAKLEYYAAYKMKRNTKLLYGYLADKKRMKEKYKVLRLEELREIFGAGSINNYKRWVDLKRYTLEPAIEEINEFGTVKLTWTPIKTGRSVTDIRIDWEWKTTDEAREKHEQRELEIDDELPLIAGIIKENIDDAIWKSWLSSCSFREEEQDDSKLLVIEADSGYKRDYISSRIAYQIRDLKPIREKFNRVEVIEKN